MSDCTGCHNAQVLFMLTVLLSDDESLSDVAECQKTQVSDCTGSTVCIYIYIYTFVYIIDTEEFWFSSITLYFKKKYIVSLHSYHIQGHHLMLVMSGCSEH